MISALPEAVLTQATTVELTATLPAVGQYTLAVGKLINFGGTSVELLDRLTNTRYDLSQQPIITLTATRANEALTGRFALLLNAGRALSTSHLAPATSHLTLFPNPARESVTIQPPTGTPQVRILDATGRVVLTVPTPAAAVQTVRLALPAGVYTVQGGGEVSRLVVE